MEKPKFMNCPDMDVLIDKMTAPGFDAPTPTDNVGMIKSFTHTPAWVTPDGVLSHTNTTTKVIYTAEDFQGNTQTCVINIRVRGTV